MDTLKLNSKQIQVVIDQLTAQPEGVNKLNSVWGDWMQTHSTDVSYVLLSKQ